MALMPFIVEDSLVLFLHKRLICIKLIAMLKVILHLPIYMSSVEKTLFQEVAKLFEKCDVDVTNIKNLIKILCKISRVIQNKLQQNWRLDKANMFEIFDIQLKIFIENISLGSMQEFCEALLVRRKYNGDCLQELMVIIRMAIISLDEAIIHDLCRLDASLHIDYIQDKIGKINLPLRPVFLYKLFLVMNSFYDDLPKFGDGK